MLGKIGNVTYQCPITSLFALLNGYLALRGWATTVASWFKRQER